MDQDTKDIICEIKKNGGFRNHYLVSESGEIEIPVIRKMKAQHSDIEATIIPCGQIKDIL